LFKIKALIFPKIKLNFFPLSSVSCVKTSLNGLVKAKQMPQFGLTLILQPYTGAPAGAVAAQQIITVVSGI
jgi:hypothetical protein